MKYKVTYLDSSKNEKEDIVEAQHYEIDDKGNLNLYTTSVEEDGFYQKINNATYNKTSFVKVIPE